MQTVYVGIDLHGNNLCVVVIDKEGRIREKGRMGNDLKELVGRLKGYEKVEEIAVESTFNWYWLVDGLGEAGYSVKLAHPAAMVAYSGMKHRGDFQDARWLAELLRLKILPSGYIYPPADRGLRDLLRKRMHLVRHRTSHLLSIGNIYARQTGKSLPTGFWEELGGKEIEQIFADSNVALSVYASWKVLRELNSQIQGIEKRVRKQLKESREFQMLQSVWGIGPILGATIRLETGQIERFSRVGNYASYCRLVQSRQITNGKVKGQGNRRNGNRYLCWAFLEAAHHAYRVHERARCYVQKKAQKSHPRAAWMALAHKLCRATYFVLRDQVPFVPQRLFA